MGIIENRQCCIVLFNNRERLDTREHRVRGQSAYHCEHDDVPHSVRIPLQKYCVACVGTHRCTVKAAGNWPFGNSPQQYNSGMAVMRAQIFDVRRERTAWTKKRAWVRSVRPPTHVCREEKKKLLLHLLLVDYYYLCCCCCC